MYAQQLQYTSCRFGQGNGPGFQIRACSEGIDDRDVAIIVRMGLHVPPDCTIHQATTQASVTVCPPALRVFTLPSGKRAIQHSLYLGCDYSGREGNFFTHSLLFEPPQQDERPPHFHDLHGWPGWCPNAEPDTAPPKPLPPVDVYANSNGAHATSTNPLSYSGLTRFLRASPERLNYLEHLVATAMLPQGTRKTMVIRDIPDNLPYWIACIIKCLPCEIADKLAYSTYQGEACGGLDLMGTVPGTAFDHLSTSTYAVFDFIHKTTPVTNMSPASIRTARKAIRKLLGQSLPINTLPAILAVCPMPIGVELLRLVHAARAELATAPLVTLTMGHNLKNHQTSWHRAPLHGLGLAFAQHTPQRLHALLSVLPPHESAAWLLACSSTFRTTPCMGEALYALGISHPAWAQSLRAQLDKAHDQLCLAAELRFQLQTSTDKHHTVQAYCKANSIPHFTSKILHLC